jgi:prophage regulatory protein
VLRRNLRMADRTSMRDSGARPLDEANHVNATTQRTAQQLALSFVPPAPRSGNQRVLRLPQVCATTGLRRSFIYQMEAQNRFPKRIKIGVRAVGWLESEVQEWLSERIDQSRRG